MTPEKTKEIKCDRCGVIIGLYRHATGWRCPQCIWNERENLVEWARSLLNAIDYTNEGNRQKQAVVVSRRSMDALADVVQEVTVIDV